MSEKDTKENPTGNEKTAGDDKAKAELSEKEQEQAIPKHRFDEVNEKYKETSQELENLRSELKKREEKELEENEKWKEIADKREKELEAERTRLTNLSKRRAIEMAAAKAGANDPEDIYRLLDVDSIKVDEDGEIDSGKVADLVAKVLEDKPYLKSDSNARNIGAGSNPSDAEQKTYPISWVKERWSDVPWTRAKHDEYDGLTGEEFLNKIEKESRIDYQS